MTTTRGPHWACWLPIASLVGVEIYARGFDGWGAWATGPLFLLPFFLSIATVLVGMLDVAREMRGAGVRARAGTLLFVAIAAIPIAWLAVRRSFV